MTTQSGWQLVTLSTAEAYSRYIAEAFGNAWAQDLIATAAPRAGERVLDVACGTGAVARYAAECVGTTGQVVGLDLNPGMLGMARAIPLPAGASIEWREADATSLPLADGSFDLVCCQQGLQFFPDKAVALAEMHRVLTPRGRLALSVWRRLEHQPFYAALTDALARYVSAQAAGSLRAAFTLGDRQELHALLTAAGFGDSHLRIVSMLTRYPSLEEYVLGYLSGTPMAAAVAGLDEATRRALVDQVVSALQAYVDDDGLAAPWEAHVVTAQA